MKKLLLVLCVIFIASVGNSQNLKIGVRTGLCSYKLLGELETNEVQNWSSGFHFAITGKYNLTENFGLRTELSYVQKSTAQEYDNFITVFNVPTPDLTGLIRTSLYGGEKFSLKKTFNIFSIPLHAVYKPTKKIELFAGIDFDFVAGVIGQGTIRFDNLEQFQNGDAEAHVFYDQTLNYNYTSDRVGQSNVTGSEVITIDYDYDNDGELEKIQIPKSLSAYFYNATDEGKAFSTFDMALSAGVAYFINPGLYVRATGNYGLLDATKSAYDHSLQDVNVDGSYIFRDDNDHRLGFQLSLGFQF